MPFILYLTNARPPSPMWHCTHATSECGGVLPRRELRVHRLVARLAAERRGFHRVETRHIPPTRTITTLTAVNARIISARAARRRRPEIDDEPFPRGVGMPHQPAVLEPHAEGNQQQAEHEERRQRDEDDERGVRVVEEAEQEGDEQGDEDHRARRGQHDARQRDRMSGQARASARRPYFFRLCM